MPAPRQLRARRVVWGGLDAVLVDEDLAAPPAGARPAPLVTLLHGFGAPGDDLVALCRVIPGPPGTRWLFPAAPLELDMMMGDARAWWMIDLERLERRARGETTDDDRSGEEPEGLAEAREAVNALLDQAAAELGPAPLVLGGFSQGAMLACDVALRGDRPLAGLALFSGTLICADVWQARAATRRGLPALVSHGTEDPLLPFAQAERLRDLLAGAGLDVSWVEFEGGHGIPPEAMQALGALLARTA